MSVEQRDRRYRYTIEVIDFVVEHLVQTADFAVAATGEGRWEISDREWPGALTIVTDTVEEALAKIGERIDNLIANEEPF